MSQVTVETLVVAVAIVAVAEELAFHQNFEAIKAECNAPLEPLRIDGKTYEERVAEMNREHNDRVAQRRREHEQAVGALKAPTLMTPGSEEWNAHFAAFDKRWEERYNDPTSVFYRGPKA